jgi:membrane protein YdbS with pleckstrin-like domain
VTVNSDAFAAPPGAHWEPVSPRLRTMRRAFWLTLLAVVVLVVAVGVAGASALASVIVVAVGVVLAAWLWWVIGRNWRSWGYTERDDDLLVVHGALFRTLVVVPYGRMQLVDLQAGPIERIFRLVKVRLHTASASTDARICGLQPDEAQRLRERLASRGEAHAAGL